MESVTANEQASDSQHQSESSISEMPKFKKRSSVKKHADSKKYRTDLSDLIEKLGAKVGVTAQQGKKKLDTKEVLQKTIKLLKEQAASREVEATCQRQLPQIVTELDPAKANTIAGYSDASSSE